MNTPYICPVCGSIDSPKSNGACPHCDTIIIESEELCYDYHSEPVYYYEH
jgi:RNA polymerase subunit RPABC4/transcription elongation factor Spt4